MKDVSEYVNFGEFGTGKLILIRISALNPTLSDEYIGYLKFTDNEMITLCSLRGNCFKEKMDSDIKIPYEVVQDIYYIINSDGYRLEIKEDFLQNNPRIINFKSK